MGKESNDVSLKPQDTPTSDSQRERSLSHNVAVRPTTELDKKAKDKEKKQQEKERKEKEKQEKKERKGIY